MRLTLIKLSFFLAIITASCSKEKECDDPIDCLPPISQTGANTAGCLVNGKALVPGGRGLNTGSVLFVQYKYSDDDDSVFGLNIVNRTSGKSKMMFIEVRNEKLVEGQMYELKSEDSHSLASYNDLHLGGFVTSDEHRGELHISKLDTEKRIVSGTFWFDAVDKEGEEIVEIRNGRFDVIY
ncbi:DUF6252 family protein [Salinimicrobium sp. GXAS 041]|uniref:DUF6252 family protein n=1 Tax=Salinimicrobium sp. GXAS 041 TaxID=3400806 RepID=UPI003C783F78